VNDLNVFPVADGDTGDNMAHTLRAVMGELNRLNGQPVDDIGRDEVVSAVARAALLGARGNSGVILSQIVRGAAEELSSRPGELVDPVLVSAALARAADAAYASVRDPAEGTMLTVIREMSHRVATELAKLERPRLTPDVSAEDQDRVLADVLEKALESAKESVERSPELLPVLREHGVIDAGGYGVTLLVAGVIAGLRDEQSVLPEVAHYAPAELHSPHESSRYRYCTNFIVSGNDLEKRSFVAPLEEIGDSVLVVGDSRTLRVHVHTDEPGNAVSVFADAGTVDRLDVADMREQLGQRVARLRDGAPQAPEAVRCGVVAVAAGAGMRALYEQLGAHVVGGGTTLNPSTFEILAGIHEIPADEVIVFPNSANVVMAAERAAELSEKTVHVVESLWPQAGLVCLVEHDPGLDVEQNAVRLRDVLSGIATGFVAPAARDDKKGRYRAGEAVGFVSEGLVAWGEPASVLEAVLVRLGGSRELLTVVAGEGAPLEAATVENYAPAGVAIEVHDGGQPNYWWLVAAE
jgi:DAK2 domain fusion protein YloV